MQMRVMREYKWIRNFVCVQHKMLWECQLILCNFFIFIIFPLCAGEINGLIDDNDDFDKDSIKKHATEHGIGHQRNDNTIQR